MKKYNTMKQGTTDAKKDYKEGWIIHTDARIIRQQLISTIGATNAYIRAYIAEIKRLDKR